MVAPVRDDSPLTHALSGVTEVRDALHPDTAPEAIRAAHLREVADYYAAHPGATVAEASAALVLPEWTIECRLAEMAGAPVPYRRRARATPRAQTPFGDRK